MLIGIDVSRTAETKTGLGSYAQSLVAAMARVDKTNEYLLYPFVWDCFPPNYEAAFCPQQANFKIARRRVPKRVIQRLWEKASAADKGEIMGGEPDVYFSPFHSVPQRNYQRLVCVYHDISFRVHPEFSTQENIDHCEVSFARAVSNADHMVTVSHFSKKEMVEKMGVPADWISVTHEAADPMFQRIHGCQLPGRIRKDIGEPDQTILYVGSVEPRKNLATLIRAYDALVSRGKSKPVLIIAGGSGWKNSDVYEEIDRRGLKDSVYFTGFVTDQELVQLYNASTIFVFPTIYEGFGLPVIEAMSCGTPVVTSRVSSIPEVGGDAVSYIDDPFDDENLCKHMEEILSSPERQEDLAARGLTRAGTFTWERTASETLAILEQVHQDPQYRRQRIEMGVDERGLARGWHPQEIDGSSVFRWAEREATVRLFAPKDSNRRLVIEAAGSIPGDEQVLAVRVNGLQIGCPSLSTEWQTFHFPLPDRIPRDQEIEIALRVNFELPPAMKGDDPRSLGFRATKVCFE